LAYVVRTSRQLQSRENKKYAETRLTVCTPAGGGHNNYFLDQLYLVGSYGTGTREERGKEEACPRHFDSKRMFELDACV
jgi:hypothetical protein